MGMFDFLKKNKDKEVAYKDGLGRDVIDNIRDGALDKRTHIDDSNRKREEYFNENGEVIREAQYRANGNLAADTYFNPEDPSKKREELDYRPDGSLRGRTAYGPNGEALETIKYAKDGSVIEGAEAQENASVDIAKTPSERLAAAAEKVAPKKEAEKQSEAQELDPKVKEAMLKDAMDKQNS